MARPDIEIVEVPQDFYHAFKSNFDDAARDIGGWPTASIKPLFQDVTGIFGCMDYTISNPLDESTMTLAEWFKPELNAIYYGHLDGSQGGDGYGLCFSHLVSFTTDTPSLPIIKLDLLGAPNRKTYGADFKPELVEELVREMCHRGFQIKWITYDRATNIRMIKDIVEPYDIEVIPMSIDKCTSYPVVDYDREPPYYRIESTKGYYDLPMVDFRNIANRKGLIVPYHPLWNDIPYAFEHNEAKKVVTKISGKQDNLGQAVAGSVFHILNNEKEPTVLSITDMKEWNNTIRPDSFEKFINTIKQEDNKIMERIVKHSGEYNLDNDWPDELGLDETTQSWNNPYLI